MGNNLDMMIYRMAYRMAMADGNLSANEALILHLMRDDLGLSDEQAEGLKGEAEKIDYDRLRNVFPERDDQLSLFEASCVVAMADGKSEVAEWELAVRLCKALDIPRDTAQECLNKARVRLKKLAKNHNLAPEIRSNLQKQGLIEDE